MPAPGAGTTASISLLVCGSLFGGWWTLRPNEAELAAPNVTESLAQVTAEEPPPPNVAASWFGVSLQPQQEQQQHQQQEQLQQQELGWHRTSLSGVSYADIPRRLLAITQEEIEAVVRGSSSSSPYGLAVVGMAGVLLDLFVLCGIVKVCRCLKGRTGHSKDSSARSAESGQESQEEPPSDASGHFKASIARPKHQKTFENNFENPLEKHFEKPLGKNFEKPLGNTLESDLKKVEAVVGEAKEVVGEAKEEEKQEEEKEEEDETIACADDDAKSPGKPACPEEEDTSEGADQQEETNEDDKEEEDAHEEVPAPKPQAEDDQQPEEQHPEPEQSNPEQVQGQQQQGNQEQQQHDDAEADSDMIDHPKSDLTPGMRRKKSGRLPKPRANRTPRMRVSGIAEEAAVSQGLDNLTLLEDCEEHRQSLGEEAMVRRTSSTSSAGMHHSFFCRLLRGEVLFRSLLASDVRAAESGLKWLSLETLLLLKKTLRAETLGDVSSYEDHRRFTATLDRRLFQRIGIESRSEDQDKNPLWAEAHHEIGLAWCLLSGLRSSGSWGHSDGSSGSPDQESPTAPSYWLLSCDREEMENRTCVLFHTDDPRDGQGHLFTESFEPSELQERLGKVVGKVGAVISNKTSPDSSPGSAFCNIVLEILDKDDDVHAAFENCLPVRKLIGRLSKYR